MTGMPPLIPLPAPAYFLSDAHLGAALIPDPAAQENRLNRFLELVADRGRALVFVGDLFDFWYEWKHVIPKRHFRLLCRLRGLADRGITLHYLSGNHDFRLKGFLEYDLGMSIHSDNMATQIGEGAVFVFHGDGLLSRDHGYRLLKRVLRNRVAQAAFSWLHPDFAMRLASDTSKTSRAITTMNANDDAEYLEFARGKFRQGFHGVVMGHTHRPIQHVEGEHTYINLGDWITHYTFGLHDGTRLSLQRLHD